MASYVVAAVFRPSHSESLFMKLWSRAKVQMAAGTSFQVAQKRNRNSTRILLLNVDARTRDVSSSKDWKVSFVRLMGV
jgi:hypothetical protein